MNIFSLSHEIINRLKERQDIYINTVISGGLQNFEDYRFLVGRITQIREDVDIIKELMKSIETNNS